MYDGTVGPETLRLYACCAEPFLEKADRRVPATFYWNLIFVGDPAP
jgi:hypothetical protein